MVGRLRSVPTFTQEQYAKLRSCEFILIGLFSGFHPDSILLYTPIRVPQFLSDVNSKSLYQRITLDIPAVIASAYFLMNSPISITLILTALSSLLCFVHGLWRYCTFSATEIRDEDKLPPEHTKPKDAPNGASVTVNK